MVSFKVDMESEALKTIERFMNMDTTPLMKDIAGSARQQTLRTYIKTMGVAPIDKPTTVYAVVKKALFEEDEERAVRGILTKSTLQSIQTKYTKTTAAAGIFGGSWPSNAGEKKASMNYVVEALEDFWGESIKKRLGMGMQERRSYWLSTGAAFEGEVIAKWDSGGFRITWPKFAKRALGLRDIDYPSESFESKEYGRTKTKADRLFYIDSKFVKDMLDVASNFINRILFQPEARGGMEISMPVRSDIAEEFNKFSGYEDWFSRFFAPPERGEE